MSTGAVDKYDWGTGRGLEAIGSRFYPLYERLVPEHSPFVDDLEEKLSESRMSYTVELYLSTALGLGVTGGLTLWFVGLALGYVMFQSGVGPILGIPLSNPTLLAIVRALRVPLVILTTGLMLGAVGFASVFGPLVVYPYMKAAERRREINLLLPDAISFMYALSVGGMSQLEILEAIAEAEDTYGEVSQEFRTILQGTEYFDTDYRSAIREQSIETPSEELSQFLTDMLSVIDSGGDMTRFLDDKKDQHFRTAKQEQETILETLELFGEVYITISLFPLLLIILLVVLSILGQTRDLIMYATVYGLIPLTGLGFLVLVSTVKQDDPGDGVLRSKETHDVLEEETDTGPFSRGLIDEFVGSYHVFDRIEDQEGTYKAVQIIKRPHIFFRDNPSYTLALTVPAALVLLVVAVFSGSAPTTWDGLIEAPVWGTFIYLYAPVLLVMTPLAVFREWNIRTRRGVLNNLSENLRKLSTANDTGMTLLESIETVAETSSGRLADEFETIYAKSNYGMGLKEALVVFNNKYRLPRLARTVKLISKAQEASSQISSVLSTAAQATENQDDIERERRSRTRMQVVLILMTFLTLLGVMAILKTRFLDVMGQLATSNGAGSGSAASGRSFGGSLDVPLLSLLFFHAITLQAITAGLISGYIRDAEILSGAKYVVSLLVITLGVWMVVA